MSVNRAALVADTPYRPAQAPRRWPGQAGPAVLHTHQASGALLPAAAAGAAPPRTHTAHSLCGARPALDAEAAHAVHNDLPVLLQPHVLLHYEVVGGPKQRLGARAQDEHAVGRHEDLPAGGACGSSGGTRQQQQEHTGRWQRQQEYTGESATALRQKEHRSGRRPDPADPPRPDAIQTPHTPPTSTHPGAGRGAWTTWAPSRLTCRRSRCSVAGRAA